MTSIKLLSVRPQFSHILFFYLKLFELYMYTYNIVCFSTIVFTCVFFSALSQVSQSTSINGTDSLEVKVSMVYFLFARWIKRIYANFPKVKCYIFENWRIKLMKIDSDVFHFVCNVQQNDMEKRDGERERYRKKNNTFLNIILIHFFSVLFFSLWLQFHSVTFDTDKLRFYPTFRNVSTINLLAWVFQFEWIKNESVHTYVCFD